MFFLWYAIFVVRKRTDIFFEEILIFSIQLRVIVIELISFGIEPTSLTSQKLEQIFKNNFLH